MIEVFTAADGRTLQVDHSSGLVVGGTLAMHLRLPVPYIPSGWPQLK